MNERQISLPLAVKVARQVQLVDVCLKNAQVLDKNDQQETITKNRLSRKVFRVEKNDEILQVELDLSVKSSSKKRIIYSIKARFKLIYLLEGSESDFTEDELASFAEINAVFNVWPYWREFVQSMSERMSIVPHLVVPVFRIADYAVAPSKKNES